MLALEKGPLLTIQNVAQTGGMETDLFDKPIIHSKRTGIRDLWGAYMVVGAKMSVHDIPLCPTTAKELPEALLSYKEAKRYHNEMMRLGHPNYHVHAFVHFFVDDRHFDGKESSIWDNPKRLFTILDYFDGMITVDYSDFADFPDPIKRTAIYRMRALGYYAGRLGYQVINGMRWGTPETWSYCFDGVEKQSVLCVGTVASGLKELENRPVFERGIMEMCRRLEPETIIVYGSAGLPVFQEIRALGVKVKQYPSEASMRFWEED